MTAWQLSRGLERASSYGMRLQLMRHPLGGRSTLVLLLAEFALVNCGSVTTPSLAIHVFSRAKYGSQFVADMPIQIQAWGRPSECDDCFSHGGTVQLLAGSTVVQVSTIGVFEAGRVTLDGQAYCLARLSVCIRDPGTYRAELHCPDGRTARTAEFSVAARP
jgi:hypothetical protein